MEKMKQYYLNKDKTSLKDIKEIHYRMEKAGVLMGSSHVSRIRQNTFGYNFIYNPFDNSYFAITRIILPDYMHEKNAEWFYKFIENGLEEPSEERFTDNSETEPTNTFLDKQLETLK